MIEVLGRTFWQVHWGGINNLGGLIGQLTKCRYKGVTFFVRENAARAHFNISGGERQALKRGYLSPRHPQILELLAPAGWWETIAAAVAEADTMRRRVRRNRNFTWSWAKRQFAGRMRKSDEQAD